MKSSTAGSPNLVVIVLDCARAKSVGVTADGGRARTPNIDTLAREGTTFTHAVAPGNWTVPSHMSLFTGTYPWVHGLRSFQRGLPQLPKIATWLAARGYETAMFTEELHLVAGYGLEEGYTHRFARQDGIRDEDRTVSNRLLGHTDFVYSPGVRRMIEQIPRLAIPLSAINFRQESSFKRRVCGSYLLEEFEHWLGTRDRSRPFHAFFNFVDAHEPYPELAARPHWGFTRLGFVQVPRYYLLAVPALREAVPWPLIEHAYRSAIGRADEKVGRLMAALDAAGLRERTLMVVTADHGQSFGEGGNVYHGCGATDSVLRVPLVVRPPVGLYEPPRQIDRWMTLCEVPSWMKSAALGLEPFDEQGVAPVPFPALPTPTEPILAEGGPASDPNRSLRQIGNEHRWNHRLVAAYRGDEKWIFDMTSLELWHWVGMNPDGRRAERLEGSVRDRAMQSVYNVPDVAAAVRLLGGEAALERPTLTETRMRSWGYD